MSSKWLFKCQARWSKFLWCFNLKIKYKPGFKCKADTLTKRSQDLPASSDSCQDYMKQVVLKPKNLSTVQFIQILCQKNTMTINILKPDLKSTIDKVYQEMDSQDPVSIIRQIITNKVYHSHHYLLSDYLLENERLYHHSKLYLPNKSSLHFHVLQESYDQPMAGHQKLLKLIRSFNAYTTGLEW